MLIKSCNNLLHILLRYVFCEATKIFAYLNLFSTEENLLHISTLFPAELPKRTWVRKKVVISQDSLRGPGMSQESQPPLNTKSSCRRTRTWGFYCLPHIRLFAIRMTPLLRRDFGRMLCRKERENIGDDLLFSFIVWQRKIWRTNILLTDKIVLVLAGNTSFHFELCRIRLFHPIRRAFLY